MPSALEGGEGRQFLAALMTVRILHGAMAVSILLFGLVLHFTAHQPDTQAVALGPAHYAMAGVFCLGGVALVVLGSVRVSRALSDAVGIAALRRAQAPMILRLAGAEAISLAGFLLSFLRGGAWMPYVAFAPVSILIILAVFPRRSMFRFE